jgi:hypothetical protein
MILIRHERKKTPFNTPDLSSFGVAEAAGRSPGNVPKKNMQHKIIAADEPPVHTVKRSLAPVILNSPVRTPQSSHP